jgi:dihydrodipicolinate synthase/N-acetylneuraminate lyase
MSAILLPFDTAGEIDWAAFRSHVLRTADAGLTPAVNMDTGYANLIDEATRVEALQQTKVVLAGRPFVAGAFVGDRAGDKFNRDAYFQQIDSIQKYGGMPVIFQSFGLTGQSDGELLASYSALGSVCDQFIGFELGQMFAPFGKIYSLETYQGLMQIRQCMGAKHSSLDREQEWARIRLRNEVRPDFKVFTGNDLAIDMVMYGSDYLLGLSTFAPDLFAKRDRMWEIGDPAFNGLNDILQYLGFFAFRNPVPAYKHTAAQFLHLRGWIKSDKTHAKSPSRPESDREILRELGLQLGLVLQEN